MSHARSTEGEATEAAWIPTMKGNTIAYVPEYRQAAWDDGELLWTKWKSIPTVEGNGSGVPYPAFQGGMFKAMGMCGYEQAQALAWSFAAQAATDRTRVEVRIAVYEFVYDLKARKLEGKEVTCEDRS